MNGRLPCQSSAPRHVVDRGSYLQNHLCFLLTSTAQARKNRLEGGRRGWGHSVGLPHIHAVFALGRFGGKQANHFFWRAGFRKRRRGLQRRLEFNYGLEEGHCVSLQVEGGALLSNVLCMHMVDPVCETFMTCIHCVLARPRGLMCALHGQGGAKMQPYFFKWREM